MLPHCSLCFSLAVIYLGPHPYLSLFLKMPETREEKNCVQRKRDKALSMTRIEADTLVWLPHVIPCNISEKCEQINQLISVCSSFSSALSPKTYFQSVLILDAYLLSGYSLNMTCSLFSASSCLRLVFVRIFVEI